MVHAAASASGLEPVHRHWRTRRFTSARPAVELRCREQCDAGMPGRPNVARRAQRRPEPKAHRWIVDGPFAVGGPQTGCQSSAGF